MENGETLILSYSYLKRIPLDSKVEENDDLLKISEKLLGLLSNLFLSPCSSHLCDFCRNINALNIY